MDNEPAPPPLAVARRDAVMAIIRELRPTRVVDLGCGEGALLQALQTEAGIDEIVGVDVAAAALTRAEKRLRIQDLTERQAQRLRLLQSSLLYRDQRLAGFDCAVLMEVIEHIDLDRLPVVERNLFAGLAPASVIITTPNAEFNARYPHLPAGTFRHSDHRFEWDRATFQAWAERVAAAHGYQVTFRPVGELDADLGPSTQLALFTRTDRGTRTDGASRTEVAA